MQSASILLYLARVYDTKFAFHFADEDEEQDMTNWVRCSTLPALP